LKALARRPEDRYQSAQELADEVKRWLSGEPPLAWREPWAARAGRWARKNRVLVASLGAAAVVALVLGVAGGVYRGQQRLQARARAAAGLAQVVGLRRAYQFGDARRVLDEQVGPSAAQSADEALQARAVQAKVDLDLAEELDKVRQEAGLVVEGRWAPNR